MNGFAGGSPFFSVIKKIMHLVKITL